MQNFTMGLKWLLPMKWFKHISDSLDDPFISDLLDEFGSDGYLVFFGILEIISREFNIKTPGKVEVSHNYLRRKLRLSWHKVSTILNFCEKKGKFFVSDNERQIVINCPKYKHMLDDWTFRKLRSDSVVTPEILTDDVDRDVDRDKDNNTYTSSDDEESVEKEFYLTKKKSKLKGKRLQTFNEFMDAFNYRSGKAEAADAWLDIPQLTNALVDVIIKGAKEEAKRRPDIRAQGKTPKMAQGWLNGKRWEDEAETDESLTSGLDSWAEQYAKDHPEEARVEGE